MQKFIAKYGTAAHLAILAVAPLFLFPFCGESSVAVVLLWLAGLALLWAFLEPSIRRGERLHDARARVVAETLRDPMFWLLIGLVVYAGLRALNDGIAMVYDAESSSWRVTSAEFFPGCVKDGGDLPFAAVVAAAVLIQGCRHSLGSSARMAFALLTSALGGLAGGIALYFANQGNSVLQAASACPVISCSFWGTAFLCCSLLGMLSVVGTLEHKWFRAMPLLVLSIGGSVAAGFAFSPARNTALFALAVLLLLVYAIVYALVKLGSPMEFKVLMMAAVCLAVGAVVVMMALPAEQTASRVAAFAEGEFLPDDLLSLRRTLSALSLKVWKSSPWLGTGVGAFPLGIRFAATPEDWPLIPHGVSAVANGYLMLLVERGFVGAAVMALVLLFLLFAYFRRLVGCIAVKELPHPMSLVGPLTLAAVAVAGWYDVSFLRGETLAVVGAILALSASAFPKKMKGK